MRRRDGGWGCWLARAGAAGVVAAVLTLGGCIYLLDKSKGGGQTTFKPPRVVRAADVALPEGYAIEAVATGLTFPTGVAVDDSGRVYVVESGYSYGEAWATPRLLRVEPDGKTSLVASGRNNGPWTGVAFHKGAFYVAEGGQMLGGAILRIDMDGKITPLIENLLGKGDHHTNGPRIGPDGMIYFGEGTATNAGVVGEDNYRFGWLKRFPDFHDIPGQDITLAGENYTSGNPFNPGERKVTGAFLPFGTPSTKGQVIKGQVPCGGSVMRIPLGGGKPELVAWGFRNPFGLAFAPDDKLYVTDNMYDDRGSRKVFGCGDLLWEVRQGVWYGWPDFHGGKPLDSGRDYASPADERPRMLLARHPNPPPQPVAKFGVHASANGFDFSSSPEFGHVGEPFVALFGDQAPDVGKALEPVGFKVVRVDPKTGVIHDFAVNKGKLNGPATRIGGAGLERPVAARFSPDGTALYVVDFGVMLMTPKGPQPFANTGVIWKITRRRG